MELAELARWTPIRFDLSGAAPVVDWADLSEERFVEPFFDQTVARWASGPRARPLVRTGLEALVALDNEPSLEPAGMIFHLSRCGSTLVSRLLGTLPGAVVLAEPSPLNALLGLNPGRVERGHAGPVGAAFGACAGPMPARRRTALGAQVHQLEYPPPGRSWPPPSPKRRGSGSSATRRASWPRSWPRRRAGLGSGLRRLGPRGFSALIRRRFRRERASSLRLARSAPCWRRPRPILQGACRSTMPTCPGRFGSA